MDEATLVTRLKVKDDDALLEFIKLITPPIHQVVRNTLRRSHMEVSGVHVDEVVSEVMVRIIKNLNVITESGNLRNMQAYCRKVAHNVALEYSSSTLRRREVSLEAYESEIDRLAANQNAEKGLEAKIATVEEQKLILDAFTEVYSKLPERKRQILSLWISGQSPSEIASSTDADIKTVYRLLKQVQKQLIETHRKALMVADE